MKTSKFMSCTLTSVLVWASNCQSGQNVPARHNAQAFRFTGPRNKHTYVVDPVNSRWHHFNPPPIGSRRLYVADVSRHRGNNSGINRTLFHHKCRGGTPIAYGCT